MVFEHDGAAPHFALEVRDYFSIAVRFLPPFVESGHNNSAAKLPATIAAIKPNTEAEPLPRNLHDGDEEVDPSPPDDDSYSSYVAS